MSLNNIWFHTAFKEFIICMFINKVRDKLGALCIICSLGYNLHYGHFRCPWASIEFCYFYTLVQPYEKLSQLSSCS